MCKVVNEGGLMSGIITAEEEILELEKEGKILLAKPSQTPPYRFGKSYSYDSKRRRFLDRMLD